MFPDDPHDPDYLIAQRDLETREDVGCVSCGIINGLIITGAVIVVGLAFYFGFHGANLPRLK